MRMASEMKNTSNWDYTHCMTVVSLEMSDEPFLVSEWLQNGGCIPSEWYRSSFGIVFRPNGACISKLASAKLQREKGDSKFFANLWRFEMLKSAHSPSVYGEKFIFL